MFKHILIPTDGSELSQHAVIQGMELAKTHAAKVTGITVSEPFHVLAVGPIIVTDSREVYEADCEVRATRILDAMAQVASENGVAFTAKHVYAAQPYEGIIEASRSSGCDLICMASHGRRGMSALLLGSETAKVLTHARVPVLVCR